MSNTDVHRPWRVQIADPCNRQILYRYPLRADEMALTSFRNIGCGCKLCTGTRGRKYMRRRERAAWRAESRVWVKGGEPRPPKNLETWM